MGFYATSAHAFKGFSHEPQFSAIPTSVTGFLDLILANFASQINVTVLGQLLLGEVLSGGSAKVFFEALLAAVESLAGDRPAPAVVTVTHHLEELPASTTHALLLRGGRVVASGAAPAVLAEEPLSACFGVPVTVTRAGGRWSARATPRW